MIAKCTRKMFELSIEQNIAKEDKFDFIKENDLVPLLDYDEESLWKHKFNDYGTSD